MKAPKKTATQTKQANQGERAPAIKPRKPIKPKETAGQE